MLSILACHWTKNVNKADELAYLCIERKNRLVMVCYVPTTSATFLAFFSFLLQLLTVLMRQTRQVVRAINWCIFLRCLWYKIEQTHLGPVCWTSSITAALGVTKFRSTRDMMLTTLCCASQIWLRCSTNGPLWTTR